jgi:hemoglobin
MTRLKWCNAMALMCALAVGSVSLRADAPPKGGDRKAADTQVFNTLRDVVNQGADLYNSGDWSGCYRLYEGALLGIRPFLDHRPELQKAIADGITRARANPDLSRRAFDLRAVIDKIRTDTNPNPKPPAAKTLWDRLGGEENVKKVVDDFVAAAAKDPKVDFFRGGKYKLDDAGVAKLKRLLVEQISSVSGGPYKYTGRTMKEVHKGMGITDAQFDATASHLQAALERNGAKPDDVKAVMGVVGSTRKDIVEPKKDGPPKESTLWERLGGEANVKKVVDDFVAAAAKDPKVDFLRGGKFSLDATGLAHLKKMLVEQISSVSGGPYKYTGRGMKEVHKGMGITNAQFDALAGHIKKALEDHSAKADDVKAVMGVIESTRKDIVEPKKEEPPKEEVKATDEGKAEDFKGKSFDVKEKGEAAIILDFMSGKKVTIKVKSDNEKADVNLFVYDADKKEVAKDDSKGPDCEVAFTPKASGKYTLVVRNLGPGATKSKITTSTK